jgi:RNA polymerase sigma factor (sigma-70 family)
MIELNGIYPAIPPELIPHELRSSSIQSDTLTLEKPVINKPLPTYEEFTETIIKVAYINKRSYVDIDDAISVASVAFFQALSHFDPTRETEFKTYAIQAMKFAVWKLRPTYNKDEIPLNENHLNITGPAKQDHKEELYATLEANLKLLDKREQEILRKLYGIDCDEMTQTEVAKSLGVCQQRVAFLKNRALNKLKNLLNSALTPLST